MPMHNPLQNFLPSLSRHARARRLVAGVAALMVSSAGWAQEAPASSWSLGVLASSATSPYRGADDNRRLLPLLAFENAHVRWAGPVLDLKLPSAGALSFALRARYEDAGYKASDSPTLAGMADRKSSIWLGAQTAWQHPLAQLSAEWLADAAHHSGGQQIKLAAEKPMRSGRMAWVPRVALVWQDSDTVNYHFGVRSGEATTGRAAYAAGSALNTEVGMRVLYGLTQQQSVFLDLHVTALGSAIKDSPLVDRSTVSGLRLGYAYRF
jgi:MipA family protein